MSVIINADSPRCRANARDQLRGETGAHLARPLSRRCGAEPRQQGACPADPSAASRSYTTRKSWLLSLRFLDQKVKNGMDKKTSPCSGKWRAIVRSSNGVATRPQQG